MRARAALLGLGAVALYVLAAFGTAASDLLPVRPVYDGLAPPAPYRYVRPPPDLADTNERPFDGKGTLVVGTKGYSTARQVVTGDGQMQVVFADGAVPARKGEEKVSITIEPLDPTPLPPPPEGVVIGGNAYRVAGAYGGSKVAAPLREPMTLVLRYPAHATVMLQQDGREWRRLRTQSAQASLQLFAEADAFGTFAAGGAPVRSRAWIAYAAAGAGVLAGVAGYLTGRRRTKRRPRRRRRPRARPPRTRRPH